MEQKHQALFIFIGLHVQIIQMRIHVDSNRGETLIGAQSHHINLIEKEKENWKEQKSLYVKVVCGCDEQVVQVK